MSFSWAVNHLAIEWRYSGHLWMPCVSKRYSMATTLRHHLLQLVALILALSIGCSSNAWHKLDVLLAEPMRNIPHLHVLLRHTQLQEDAANVNARWFMQLTDTPHCMHSYDEQQPLEMAGGLLSIDDRDSMVLVISLAQLIFNNGSTGSTQRSTVFFYIVGDQVGKLSPSQKQELEHSCRQMWTNYRVYNRFILTDTDIWIYDPFAPSDQVDWNNSQYENEQDDTFEESFGRLVHYVGGESLPTLLFRDMRGYPLRVQMFRSVYARPVIDPKTGLMRRIYGVDWQVATTLRDRLNFTMQLQQPDKNYFGERSANGSYNGAIGSILRDGLDICLTGFFVKDYLVHEFMDFTVAVYDDQLCIYVPKAKPIPQSILPIFAVGYDIWLGFILMAFVCAFIWLLLRLINLQLRIVQVSGRKLWQQALGIMVDTWVVWVRVNLLHLPESYAERMFIGSLCLVSVIFGAIFESSLATVYIHPLHYKDIITMQDLDDSGLKVVYKFTSMADDLFFSSSPLFASLNKKLWWNPDLNADVTNEVATVGGKAGVSRYSSLTMESVDYLLTQRIWVVPECPKYYTISYVLPRDAPWKEAVNGQLLRLLNGGFIQKWIQDQRYNVTVKMRTVINQAEGQSSPVRVLTIGDLQLAFYVVIVGTLLGWLGFLMEHAWARNRVWKEHKYF